MPVVIVGNSGAARECYWLLRQCQEADASAPAFKGFLAWKGYPGKLCELDSYLLGNSESYQPAPDDLFVIGIGKPAIRLEVYAWLKSLDAEFYTLKHPDVYLCPSARNGEGNIFQRGCLVLANAVIGHGNFFNGGTVIGHDAEIGDCNTFFLSTAIGGGARIGNANQFAPACQVLPHVRIGDHNVFAPGAIVYRGCRDHCLMAGNPALIQDVKVAKADNGQ